ncbi:MAG: hypothetical protein V3T22_12400 [Planctomycetota bacterium]
MDEHSVAPAAPDAAAAPAAPAAAIDLGTNTALLLIARARADGSLEVLLDLCETARLGEGVARTGRLDDVALTRTLGVLEGFQERLAAHGVEAARLRVVGTAVLRAAADAPIFLALCRDRLGLEVQVLSEAEEARLAHCAVIAGGARADAVVVDVGGGSSEVVTDRGRVRASAPVGAVVLTERFLGLGGREPLTPGGWPALCAAAREAAARFPAAASRGHRTVLLGGTATNLACLELGLPAFDPAAVEGAQVPAHSAANWADELAGRPLAARQTLPIEADRVEILPAGLACLAACLEQLQALDVRVSGRGLRYAVLREILALD